MPSLAMSRVQTQLLSKTSELRTVKLKEGTRLLSKRKTTSLRWIIRTSLNQLTSSKKKIQTSRGTSSLLLKLRLTQRLRQKPRKEEALQEWRLKKLSSSLKCKRVMFTSRANRGTRSRLRTVKSSKGFERHGNSSSCMKADQFTKPTSRPTTLTTRTIITALDREDAVTTAEVVTEVGAMVVTATLTFNDLKGSMTT